MCAGGKTGKAPGIGGSPFTLLKKPRTVLPAMGAVQIPFSFSPLEIAEARATLTVHCGPRDLTWTYNIRGIAEAPLSEEVIDISCKARSSKTVPLSFVLPNLRLSGVPDEHFTHELIVRPYAPHTQHPHTHIPLLCCAIPRLCLLLRLPLSLLSLTSRLLPFSSPSLPPSHFPFSHS